MLPSMSEEIHVVHFMYIFFPHVPSIFPGRINETEARFVLLMMQLMIKLMIQS